MLSRSTADALNMRGTDRVLVVGRAFSELTWIGHVAELAVADDNTELKDVRRRDKKFDKVIVSGELVGDEYAVVNSISVSSGLVACMCADEATADRFSEMVQRNYPSSFVWRAKSDGVFVVMTTAHDDPDWMVS